MVYIKSKRFFNYRKINIDTCDIAPLDDDNFNHLAELCTLEALHDINLSSSDFFSHSLFQYLEVRGDQITTLILRDIDEMNLNAVILIGDRCSNLKTFALIQCHFQMEIGDTLAVERIVSERSKKNENTIRPFQNQGKVLVDMFMEHPILNILLINSFVLIL